MAKHIFAGLSLAACLCAACTATHQNSITWETLGNTETDGRPTYIQRFTIDADGPFDRMAFCMFKRSMTPVDSTDTIIEILPGYFAIGSPKFAEAKAGDPIVVDVVVDAALRNISYSPDGMHLVRDGKPVRVENILNPRTSNPAQWQTESRPDGMV